MTRPHCQQPGDACQAKGAGHCRSCVAKWINASPEMQERRAAAIRAKHAEPEFRKQHVVRATARLEEVRERRGPEWLKAQGRYMRQFAETPAAREAFLASRPQAARKISDTRLAWCPPELRDEYRSLIRSKRLPAAEARAVIEAEIVREAPAARAAREGREVVARIAAEQRAKHQRDLEQRY